MRPKPSSRAASRAPSGCAGAAHDGINSRALVLWTHTPPNFSKSAIVLNPTVSLPEVTDSELLQVSSGAAWAEGKTAPVLVFTPAQASIDSAMIEKQQHQLHLSIATRVAALAGLSNRQSVVLSRTPRSLHTISHVELYFKDQFLGRDDMWRLATSLQDQCVFVGHKVNLASGVRATIGRIFVRDKRVLSGYVAPSTKTIFRSESAKYTIFIQMAREMWEFDESGELYYEKLIHGFLPELYSKWQKIGTNHVVSIVLFARVFYEESERNLSTLPIERDARGRKYQDFYKVILDLESNFCLRTVLRLLKEEYFRFRHDILFVPGNPGSARLGARFSDLGAMRFNDHRDRIRQGKFAYAHEGNILETINMALNQFENQHIDRDLTRTGVEVMIVTAGTGHFAVDSTLLRLTTQRVADMGVALDLVCLTNMPLHLVPLFYEFGQSPDASYNSKYTVPFWINCSFYNIEQDRWLRSDRFVPRCRMHGVYVTDAGREKLRISVPHLGSVPPQNATERREMYERFDHDLFTVRAPGSPPQTRAQTTVESAMISLAAVQPAWGAPSVVATPKSEYSPTVVTPSGSSAITATLPTIPPTATGDGLARATTDTPSAVHSLANSSMSFSEESMMRSVTLSSIDSSTSRVSRVPHLENVGKAPALVARTIAGAESRSRSSSPAAVARHPERMERTRTGFFDGVWNAIIPRGRPITKPITASHASRLIQKALESRSSSQNSRSASEPEVWPGSSPALPERAKRVLSDLNDRTAGNSRQLSYEEDNSQMVAARTPINPCSTKPHAGAENESIVLRWQQLFPESHHEHLIKWWSMTSPACLPLTTLYMPNSHELSTQWQEYPHTISVMSDMDSLLVKRAPSTSPALAVLREMTAQRLSQGFQFVVMRESGSKNVRHPSELLRPGNFSEGTPIVLSTPTQIHSIRYSRQSSTINVKRYITRSSDTVSKEYNCRVWPRNFAGYQDLTASFETPDPHRYNWTYLDSLIAGYEESLHDSLLYWRARFVLVPCEGRAPTMTAASGELLSDEEVRIQGADKLAELFARAQHVPPGKKTERNNVVRFLPTTLDPSSSLHDAQFVGALSALGEELRRPGESSKASRTAKSRSLDELAAELHASKRELKVNDRLWHRVLYQNTVTGADVVTWLCRTYSDIRSRDEAVTVGTRLLAAGYIVHVHHSHGFLDGHYFYRLHHGDEESGKEVATGVNDKPTPKGQPLSMSRTIVIDMDPGSRSEHAELAVLHHDLAHNPDNGFNFQIHWLGATARLIEDLVQGWARIMERYGLRLVEAPIGQIMDASKHNPFEAPLPIKLAVPPPSPESYKPLLSRAWKYTSARSLPEPRDEDEQWLFKNILSRFTTQADELFEMALLRRFGFVLDQEASRRYSGSVSLNYLSRPSHMDYTQFVHRSGVAFVQIKGGSDGFLWLNNRLFTSHMHQSRPLPGKLAPAGPDKVRRNFQQFCADKAALNEFYSKVWSSLEWLAPDNDD
ncbi:vacuolar membrane-associated protein iml1 [Malassezia cuniculi]|uniref:Vacuolar membrane-associated protein IML1 n=1 Tax=Malassezia cuniculi TaxID=948313 RepID=A0AAF0EPH9_9BASI|nr:vacuolar membrane-associated protein iml1 [Malassezia cuniculi]